MPTDIVTHLDKFTLAMMNWLIPDTLETTYQTALSFAEVLAQTQVNTKKTAVSQLLAPGTHPIWLHTPTGELCCRVKVRLAVDPQAPLIIYHHGLNEYPPDSSWRRLFAWQPPLPMHHVFIQAPYHDNWTRPLTVGFSSLQHIYQMLAGSLCMMALVQETFEAQGVSVTAVAGVSWGGIASLLYEGIFQCSYAVIPMLASPNIAQAMWDIAELMVRPLTVSKEGLFDRLDFTPIYRRINHDRVYPLLGQQDQFFRWEHHAPLFSGRPLVTVPGSHISNLWRVRPLRQHLLHTLSTSIGIA